jgi:type IV pilus assembly protein PilA
MTNKQNKGFTLLEILLVIAAIGILAAIVLVAINPNRQLAQARNTVRQADINTIQKAVEQYLIEKGSYPNGITNTYREICNTGSNNNTQGTVSNECIDLRELVPDYIASIPVNPSTSTHSGYYAWINDVNNKVAVLAGKGENGKVIGVNHLKENIVTDGLVLHLDAGNLASYPGTGNTWFDLSGQHNHLTWSLPSPTYTTYNNVPIISTTNTYTSPRSVKSNSYNGMRTGNSSYSVSSFFKPNLLSSSKILLSFGPADNSCGGQTIHPIAIGSAGKFVGGSCGGLGTWNNSSGVIPTTDKFWNITTTYNETIENVYINGVLEKSASSFLNNTPVNTSNIISLGWIRNDGASFSMDASIGNILIYNKALTPEEIQQNYNVSRGRFGL